MRAVGGTSVLMEKRMPLLPMSTMAWRWEGDGGWVAMVLVGVGGVGMVVVLISLGRFCRFDV